MDDYSEKRWLENSIKVCGIGKTYVNMQTDTGLLLIPFFMWKSMYISNMGLESQGN